MNKRSTTWIRTLVLLLVFAGSIGPKVHAQDQKDSKEQEKAAIVNGTIIPMKEVDRAVEQMNERMALMGIKQAPTPEQLSAMKLNILERIINRELLYQESVKLGIKADEAEINERFAELKSKFSNEEEFKSTLEKANMNEEGLRKEVAQEIAIKKLIDQQVMAKVKIGDNETKAYYDQNLDSFKVPEKVCASHILIKVDPKANEAEKAKARQELLKLQDKIKNGGDFAELAKEFSDCPSKEKGGDLGCFGKGQMAGPFEEAAFKLEPGQMSDIVETKFGYHLIKVTDKKAPRVITYDEVKERIEQTLKREKSNEELNQYLAQLKEKSDIQRFIEEPAKPDEKAETPSTKEKSETPKGDKSDKESAKEGDKPAKQ